MLRGDYLLIEYEWQHLEPSNRKNPDKLLDILYPNFKEFGKSGKVFYKNDINNMAPNSDDFTINNFEVYVLGDDARLCTYELVNNTCGIISNRSSVWQFYNGDWLLLFHQGTEKY